MTDAWEPAAREHGGSGRYHTNWLNMMYPRLRLQKFLREDGVIFISIDDHEVANLRKICDEIFGEENFIATIVRAKKEVRIERRRAFSRISRIYSCYTQSANKNAAEHVQADG